MTRDWPVALKSARAQAKTRNHSGTGQVLLVGSRRRVFARRRQLGSLRLRGQLRAARRQVILCHAEAWPSLPAWRQSHPPCGARVRGGGGVATGRSSGGGGEPALTSEASAARRPSAATRCSASSTHATGLRACTPCAWVSRRRSEAVLVPSWHTHLCRVLFFWCGVGVKSRPCPKSTRLVS